jgi:hypothetical protein
VGTDSGQGWAYSGWTEYRGTPFTTELLEELATNDLGWTTWEELDWGERAHWVDNEDQVVSGDFDSWEDPQTWAARRKLSTNEVSLHVAKLLYRFRVLNPETGTVYRLAVGHFLTPEGASTSVCVGATNFATYCEAVTTPIYLPFDGAAISPPSSSGSTTIGALQLQFDVTDWNVTVRDATNHIVAFYDPQPDHYATSLPRLGVGSTFELSARVRVSTAPESSGAAIDDLCAGWKARVFQNVVAHSNHVVRWTTNCVAYSIDAIPGYDHVEDDSSFAHCGDEVMLSVADTPGDSLRPLWWPLAGRPSNPLTQIARDTTFVTWLVAQEAVSGHVKYLKWVKWRVAYDVGFVVTETNAMAVPNVWNFQIIDQGTGRGDHEPTFREFNERATPGAMH